MKVLFVNDTRIETNPGCHATVNELSKFTLENLPNATIDFLPLGTEYNIFSHTLFKRGKLSTINEYLTRILLRLKLVNQKKHLDIKLWERIAQNNLSKQTKNKIDSSDLVLINMEGTIHHDSIGGLVLLAIAYYSKKNGKKVAMVNGSYQAMDTKVTKKVLNEVDFISVRETKSLEYLFGQNIKASLIPDFAFRADINSDEKQIYDSKLSDNLNERKCLYTVGVLGVYPNQANGIDINTIKKHISDIKRLGYKPYYLKIEEKEEGIEKELQNIEVDIISYEQGMNYTNIGTVLNSFDLLVTGRYHIGIFGLMNRIPTFFLKSNTFKIEGLLNMFDLEYLMVFNNNIYSIKDRLLIEDKYILPDDNSYKDFKKFLEEINK